MEWWTSWCRISWRVRLCSLLDSAFICETFICEIEAAVSWNQVSRKEKKKKMQENQNQYKCRQCGQVLNSQEALRDHEKTHQGQAQQGGRSQQQSGGQARTAGGGQTPA